MTTSSGHTSAIRATKVIGTAVKDSSGKAIGAVEDLTMFRDRTYDYYKAPHYWESQTRI